MQLSLNAKGNPLQTTLTDALVRVDGQAKRVTMVIQFCGARMRITSVTVTADTSK